MVPDSATVRHIVIDCETLSLRHNAVVIQIGAAVVTRQRPGLEYYVESALSFCASLPIMDQLLKGRHIDPNTVKWWADTDPAKAMGIAAVAGTSSFAALHELTTFIDSCRAGGSDEVYVWGNGPLADIAWLESLYQDHSQPAPWKYFEVRDIRTVAHIFAAAGGKELPRTVDFLNQKSEQHDALCDAKAEARILAMALNKIAINPSKEGVDAR